MNDSFVSSFRPKKRVIIEVNSLFFKLLHLVWVFSYGKLLKKHFTTIYRFVCYHNDHRLVIISSLSCDFTTILCYLNLSSNGLVLDRDLLCVEQFKSMNFSQFLTISKIARSTRNSMLACFHLFALTHHFTH